MWSSVRQRWLLRIMRSVFRQPHAHTHLGQHGALARVELQGRMR